MTPADIDRVFGRGRLKMVTGEHVEVFREESLPGERRRYTKRFLCTSEGDFRRWTEREWRILARLVGHGVTSVPDVVRFERGAQGRCALVQTYDAGITVDHWTTLLPVERDGLVLRHIFEDCAHWWALARHCLAALDAIHALQLVHLDLKADNVCIPIAPADFDPAVPGQVLQPQFEQIALIDFAFSLVSGEPLATALPIGHQTDYDYQSPRLLHALAAGRQGNLMPTRQLDWRCDLFSLAAMLRRCLPAAGQGGAGGWTHRRHAQAEALVERLFDAHHGPATEPRPHPQLIERASAALHETELASSLQRGWILASDTLRASGEARTPVTRIAMPVTVPAVRIADTLSVSEGDERAASDRVAPVGVAAAAAIAPAPAAVPRVRAGSAPPPAPDAHRRHTEPPAPPVAAARWHAPARGRSARAAAPVPPRSRGGLQRAFWIAAVAAVAASLPWLEWEDLPHSTLAKLAAPAVAVARSEPVVAAGTSDAHGAEAVAAATVESAPRTPPARERPPSAPAPEKARPPTSSRATTATPRGGPALKEAAAVTPRQGAVAAPATVAPVAASRAALRAPVAAATAAVRPTAVAAPRPAARPTPVKAVPVPPPVPAEQPVPVRRAAAPAADVPLPRPLVVEAPPAAPAVPRAAAVRALPPVESRVIARSLPPVVSRAVPPRPPVPAHAVPSGDMAAADPEGPSIVAAATRFGGTPVSVSSLPPDFAGRADTWLAEHLPRLAQRAERAVLPVLHAAAQADEGGSGIDVVQAARAMHLPDDAAWEGVVAADTDARRLHEAAAAAFWDGGDAQQALSLQLRAFGANPLEADIAGNLAFYYLKQRPASAEAARRLALYALTLPDSPYPAGRVEDWTTFAIASALAGRERDARHAFFVTLALSPNVDRPCRAATAAHAAHGERLRAPTEAMLARIRTWGRSDESPFCRWPPNGWVSVGVRVR